jgi:hypothetical protein
MIKKDDSEKSFPNHANNISTCPKRGEDKEQKDAFYDHTKRLYVEAVQSLNL